VKGYSEWFFDAVSTARMSARGEPDLPTPCDERPSLTRAQGDQIMYSRNVHHSCITLASLVVLAGCTSPASTSVSSAEMPPRGLAGRSGIALNGIALNGIALNGIALNGIALNGIALNGIALNGVDPAGSDNNGLAPGEGSNGLAMNGLGAAGFAAPEFAAWFAKDPPYSDMVMKYVARCALPENGTLAYTDGASGTAYQWAGTLGLTPVWASGEAIPTGEQETFSACLAAHVNGLGRHVQISIRGYLAAGTAIPVTEAEAATFGFHEAVFVGNVFDGTGVGVALEADSFDPAVTTPRGCAAEFGVPQLCLPMVPLGSSVDLCTAGDDGVTWSDCVVSTNAGPRHFKPVQTFLQASDVYHCGDGVCQFTENSATCPADCADPAQAPAAP
jgi:hypothetical protein